MRIGFGVDVHRFAPGDRLMLGGVEVPAPYGVEAHSDGDVILHALCDALLGAAALGDIGEHFPDTDAQWRNEPSGRFVERIVELLSQQSFRVVNVDVSLLLETPKIAPYKRTMQENIAALCRIAPEAVSIKATTSEQIGFVGRKEGLAAYCVCLIEEVS
ncbi:MAG: 2-C-methyl-D-erythritol 2,4-cyclodiphosphate synthase [Chlorobi bacterium NICIL-2]|jgi:2-C-methyl-D-erythritol 2,4-cyclodiphosphate synthase|nr:MAG: 2-C-methyl-D-erythritol 2,4-cyclodiphosphate synthase [Chlorobi bacterium NICIL-2]